MTAQPAGQDTIAPGQRGEDAAQTLIAAARRGEDAAQTVIAAARRGEDAAQTLIAAAQRGDEAALLQLLRACRADLTRYARRTCQSEDVEEAVQDALWVVYRHARGLRAGAALSAWMFQVVRRICLRVLRRRQAWTRFAAGPIDQDHPAASAEDGLRLDLARALAHLPPALREVLILRDLRGFAAAEAAAALGISVEATKSRLHRARAAMRDLLAADTDDTVSTARSPRAP